MSLTQQQLETLFGMVIVLEGELLAERLDPALTDNLSRWLPTPAGAPELRLALANLSRTLRSELERRQRTQPVRRRADDKGVCRRVRPGFGGLHVAGDCGPARGADGTTSVRRAACPARVSGAPCGRGHCAVGVRCSVVKTGARDSSHLCRTIHAGRSPTLQSFECEYSRRADGRRR